MKYLIITLFLMACSNSLEYSKLKQSNVTKVLENSKLLNGDLDMFVAFYWPKKFETGESALVQEIISESQNLIKIKESYYKDKFKFSCEFESLECFCVVNRTCTQEPTDQRFNQCQLIDQKLQLNDERLIDFSISIFNIQDNLDKFSHRGHWVKTHSDFQRSKATSINMNENTIFIPSWDQEYSNITVDIKSSPRKIDFSFNLPSGTSVEAFADIKETQYYQQGIGEIKEYKKTKLLRKGVLFFETSSLSNLKCNQDTLE